MFGNSEDFGMKVDMPIHSTPFQGNQFEVYIRYQLGKYWLTNSKEYAVRDLYLKLGKTEQELRPEDIIRVGNSELKVCRFNIGRADDIGTKKEMEDKIIAIQDLVISESLDVSLFAVLDG